MKIRFVNAKILPMTGENGWFSGELATEDDRIAYVGPARSEEAPSVAFDRVIDCGGDLLLPGFCNAHAHSAMTFLRSLADDLPLERWLHEQVFPMEGKLTPEDAYTLTRLAFLEYLSSGITSCFDMYYYRDTVAQAAVDAGFRTVLMDGANDYGGSPERALSEYERIKDLSPLVSYRFGLHSEYTSSKSLLSAFAEFAHAYRVPIYSHMNETAAEVAGCVERHGMRPFELFDALGLFDFGGAAFHCVHLSKREIEILRARNVYAVTCPGSNCKLGSGVAPLEKLLAAGVPVAIGTDGAASNNALDMFREMYLVCALQKLEHGAAAMPADDVLAMACRTGAAAMGLPDCGTLAPGKQADVVRVNLRRPNMQPENQIVKNLVYSGSKENVHTTMVAGRILYENGVFTGNLDPERLYADANAIVSRMKNA